MIGRKILTGCVAVALLAGGCSKADDSKAATKALNRGLQEHVDGHLTQAAKSYREVLKRDKRNKFAIYNLGLIDQVTGHPTAAEGKYRLALQIDPDYEPALFNLAILQERLGRTDEAVTLYHRAIAVSPKDARAHLNLGLLLRSLGRGPEGDAEVDLAHQIDPNLGSTATTSTTR